jgi:TonB family protein
VFVGGPYARLAGLLAFFLAPSALAQDAGAPDASAGAAPASGPRLTRPPRLKAPPRPLYPPAALAAGVSADVTLQLDIDAAGRVTAVVLRTPAGQGFDEAARSAAAAMVFEPAEIDGVPGAIRVEYIMRFRPPVATPDAGADGGAAATDAGAGAEAAPPPPPERFRELLARGRIRERGTRDPIGDAEVMVQRGSTAEPERTGTTDPEGRFVVRGLPGERVRLVVADGEHEPCIQDLTLPAAEALALDLDCMVTRRQATYETIIEAPRRGEEVTRHSLSKPELSSVPGTMGDPLRVIQSLPGVARSPYGLGLLLIRGASPQDSGVYIDGHRVPLLYHFAVGPSILTPDLIDRIDFYPGGFGVRYGRATAGVVDVSTRGRGHTRLHGSADVDFLDAGASLEGPLGGGWSGAVAARRSYIDTLLPAVLPENEVVAAPVYWDYQARVSRELARGERLSLFAFGSSDTLDVVTNSEEGADLDLGTSIGFHRLLASWTRNFGKWSSRLSPSYGYDAVSFRAGMVAARGSAQVLGLREDLNRPLGSSLTLAMGLDAELRFDGIDFNVPVPPERRTYGRTRRPIVNIARTLTNLGTAGYLELLWDVVPALRIVPGARFDWFHYSTTDKTSFDPRVVVRWTASPSTTLKGGAGIFHQPPTPVQLDSQFGNPSLPLVWADQYHLGLEQGITQALSLDTTIYYLRRHDIAVGSSRMGADGGLERYAPHGHARGYGLEVLLKHRPTREFYGWIAYTLSRSEDRRLWGGEGTPPSTPFRPTQFDQTHNLIVVASRQLGSSWEVGTRFRLVTGVPETEVLGAYLDIDYGDWDPVEGPENAVRRQVFHQLDLRAERTFTFDAWRFSIYLDVQNVYNAENPEATLHDYRYRESAPVRGLPILPVLGVRGRF